MKLYKNKYCKEKKMNESKRLQSGIRLQDGLGITIEFLEYYLKWLQENQSFATNTIKDIEGTLDAIQGPDNVEDLFKIE